MPQAPAPPGADRRAALRIALPTLALVLLVSVCVTVVASSATAPPRLDALGREFTRLALTFAQHRPDEVDSYFGPAFLRPPSNAARIPLPALARRAHALIAKLDAAFPPTCVEQARQAASPPPAAHPPHAIVSHPASAADACARSARLGAEARALATVIDSQLATTPRLSFADEARRTYGISLDGTTRDVPTEPPGLELQAARATAGPDRRRFVIPPERRRAVFDAALRACRARTASHWALPPDEHLEVTWDSGAPAAWHRYEGHGRSTLTINPAALTFIDAAIDLACHEGYPGHHTQFLLADRSSDTTPVPVEETIALLRSPVAMLREAAANYAVDLAFPPEERLRFERDTLFPLAGLDPATAADSFAARREIRALEPAIIPILRDYRDGRLTAAQASERLERRALVSSPQALLRFVDDLGPYVLGYTVARDRLADFITAETRAGRGDAWSVLRAQLIAPDPAAVFSLLLANSAIRERRMSGSPAILDRRCSRSETRRVPAALGWESPSLRAPPGDRPAAHGGSRNADRRCRPHCVGAAPARARRRLQSARTHVPARARLLQSHHARRCTTACPPSTRPIRSATPSTRLAVHARSTRCRN